MTNYRKTYVKNGKKVGGRLVKLPTVSQSQQIAQIAVKGFKAAMFVKGLINVEKKYKDTLNEGQSTTHDGSILDLFTTAHGTSGLGNRIGSSIMVKNITVRGFVRISSGNDANILRLIIFRDHCNSITSVGDYLQTPGNSGAVLTLKQHDSRFNTTRIYDKTFVLDTAKSTLVQFQHSFRNVNKHVQYADNSNTVTHNAFKYIVIQSGELTSVSPTITLLTQVEYIDN